MKEIQCKASRAKQLRLWEHVSSLQSSWNMCTFVSYCWLWRLVRYLFLTKWFINKNVTNKNHQNGGFSAIFTWLPPSSPWTPPNFGDHAPVPSPFPTLHRGFWTSQAAGEGGGEVGKYSGLKVCRCSKAWTIRKALHVEKNGHDQISWNTNMDVEDKRRKGNSGGFGGTLVFVLRCLYVFVKLKSMSCQIWPKICRTWSCWTHLIQTKAYCKCFTVSFIEGVNMYVYIYTSKFT